MFTERGTWSHWWGSRWRRRKKERCAMTPSDSRGDISEVKFLTVAEVAAMMRVSKMTVYRLVHNGERVLRERTVAPFGEYISRGAQDIGLWISNVGQVACAQQAHVRLLRDIFDIDCRAHAATQKPKQAPVPACAPAKNQRWVRHTTPDSYSLYRCHF